MKQCTVCKIEKELTEFRKHRRQCKACCRTMQNNERRGRNSRITLKWCMARISELERQLQYNQEWLDEAQKEITELQSIILRQDDLLRG